MGLGQGSTTLRWNARERQTHENQPKSITINNDQIGNQQAKCNQVMGINNWEPTKQRKQQQINQRKLYRKATNGKQTTTEQQQHNV
jgi:hypothetical protein